jgi:hypothetical protein
MRDEKLERKICDLGNIAIPKVLEEYLHEHIDERYYSLTNSNYYLLLQKVFKAQAVPFIIKYITEIPDRSDSYTIERWKQLIAILWRIFQDQKQINKDTEIVAKYILPLADHKNSWARRTATRYLPNLPAEQGITTLLKLAHDSNRNIKEEAVVGLIKLASSLKPDSLELSELSRLQEEIYQQKTDYVNDYMGIVIRLKNAIASVH